MNQFRPSTPNANSTVHTTELPLERSSAHPEDESSYFRGPCQTLLSRLDGAKLNIIEGDTGFQVQPNTDAHQHHSQQSANQPQPETLDCRIEISNPTTYRRVMLGSTIGAAESYIDGQWGCNDLTTLVRVMIRNLSLFDRVDRGWARVKNVWHWVKHLLRRNTIAGSRQNILEHYDLGNDFYRLFLDPTMSYSSAVFPELSGTLAGSDAPLSVDQLERASVHKMELVGTKLDICADDHVLEIGTGWGGMAIHLASTTGCRVTTTTISEQQFQHARAAVESAGLSDRVTVLKQDYRLLEGQYDKLVSIEMIEAVGHQFFDQFFSTCSQLLKPGGSMLLQAIVIADELYAAHIRKVDFIRRYVFPGGCLPSQQAIKTSIAQATTLQLNKTDDYTLHYALTLRHWRQRFMARLPDVKTLGHDDRFIRFWHFYLCYCEAAFLERRVKLVQMKFLQPA